MQVNDKVHGPGNILNAANKRVVMTVATTDVAPGESKKIQGAQGVYVPYHNCTYTLNDTVHTETFREDSLTPAS